MAQGKVTYVAVSENPAGPLPWRAANAVAQADFIWATTAAPPDLLRHAARHADIIIDGDDPALHSVLPLYALASGGGFRITQICSRSIAPDEIREQIDRCHGLGLEFEIVRCS